MATIEFESVSKRYGRVLAVDRLDLRAEPGRVTGLLGANGAGKTTSLSILLGLTHATSGRATIGGRRIGDLADPARTVGAALDGATFHPGRRARDHLHGLALAGGIDRRRVDEVVDLVGLGDVAQRRVGGFSLGMRSRLALAAALLGDPQVLVLDEPTNGFDPAGIRWLRGLLRGFAAQGRTVLLSSHLLGEVALTADDVVIVDRGRVVDAGPIDRFEHHLEEQFFERTGATAEGSR